MLVGDGRRWERTYLHNKHNSELHSKSSTEVNVSYSYRRDMEERCGKVTDFSTGLRSGRWASTGPFPDTDLPFVSHFRLDLAVHLGSR